MKSDDFDQRRHCFHVFRRSEPWAREISVQNHIQSFDLHELGLCRLDLFHFLLHLQIIVHTFFSNSIALFFRMRVPSLGKQIPVIVRQQIRFGSGNYLRTIFACPTHTC